MKGTFRQIEQRLRRRRVICYLTRCAAVAIIFIVGAIGFDALYLSKESHPLCEDTSPITPGGSRAYLQLSTGEVVPLSDEKKLLKERDGISIEVSNEGEISYYVQGATPVERDELFNKLIVPRGGEFVVTLDDGTRVWLNSGTEFRYPANFISRQREVYLKGEAYFEVETDTARPFVVNVNDCAVKVYGTKFNINTHREGTIQTVLVSGSVAFRDGNNEIRLRPGDKVEYREEDGNTKVEQVEVRSYIAWKEGTFVFENESLEDIMATLSLWYDVEVFYTCSEAKQVRLTGEMKRYKDVRELLYFFERISNIKFTINGKIIAVSEK